MLAILEALVVPQMLGQSVDPLSLPAFPLAFLFRNTPIVPLVFMSLYSLLLIIPPPFPVGSFYKAWLCGDVYLSGRLVIVIIIFLMG